MKIVADSNIPFVAEAFAQFGEVNLHNGRKITHDLLDGVEILLVRSGTKVNEGLLHDTPVKFVATATIGNEHVAQEYLTNNCIGFANAPGSNADSVADYVVSALLHVAFMKGIDLSKKTCGIIGLGNVGSRVFKRMQALGLHCIVSDPPKGMLTKSDFYRPLEELLEIADIVTMHTPFVADGDFPTVKMANAEFFARMKEGAIFINTGRGKNVDEKALLNARRKLGGIILDVWDTEPIPNPETIKIVDIATPHIAGHSFDGKLWGTTMIYEAACAFFFAPPTWSPQSILAEIPDIVHRTPPGSFSLYEAVRMAYPIMDDDLRFREIIGMTDDAAAIYFDSLRVNYPKRLEFFHNRFEINGLFASQREQLRGLGFTVAGEA